MVLCALELLDVNEGPIISDFPDDEPPTAGDQSGWACPLNFARPVEELSGTEAIVVSIKNEISQFAVWYDKAIETRGRTTVDGSGLTLDEIAELFGSLFADTLPPSPVTELPLADVVRLCAEDIKAYFLEAAAAQPGDPGSRQLAKWFWNETATADVF